MNCIDTHIHTWNFQRASYSWLEGNTSLLNRNYLIEELEQQLQPAGVTEGLLVQAANTIEETAYMLEVAEQNQWLKGVVGWLPLMQPEEVAKILAQGYARHPLFKGVRHLIHDEPDPGWLLQPQVIESLQLIASVKIPYDVVGVLPEHLETVLELLKKVPALTMVLDHLNQPPVKRGEKFGKWGERIIEIARHPNVYAKISGLGTTTGSGEGWGVNDIKPYVEFALEQFGASRCFCGGDWPVSLLAGSYEHAWTVYRQTLLSLLEENEVAKIFYDNAKQFYKL
ncbi:MAG TPA: amidohydrolase family protein [Flavisolibacter sp.]|nr:amidohydrolase family protein [Flavisolibacter sp.]